MEMLNLPGRLEGLLSSHGSILPKGAEHEIPLIQRDLQEIISIIHGRCEPQLQGHGHACWITEVRELAYDLEDCIDLYEHAAAAAGPNTIPRRRNITRRRWSTTRSKRIPWISDKLKQRLWMANKIREFSLRTQEALQRHKMCNNLAGIITARGNDASSESGHHPAPCSEFGQVTHVGIDAAMNKMEEWLLDREEKLKVISIVGVAGVGKTTLANEIYRKLGGQFDCRVFVRSSQKPDMRRLLVGMLSQVRPHQPPHSNSWKVHNLISTIRTHLQDKRYFIIIDDLWATSALDIIKYALPDNNNFSRILVTTEIEDLALQSCGYNSKYIFKMKPLGEDDSRNLFLTTVFASPSKCPPELSEVSYDIARKCAGFPLAIVTIGKHLATQHEKQEQWDYVNKSLGYSLMKSPPLEGMKQLLNLVYNNLPQHLKACMLYLSMYKEDYIIWKEDLVNQWMAEGFICEAGCADDKEKISGGYFDELVVRKIIQPIHINGNGEVLSCVVHSVVLNFITYKSIEENFMIAIDHSQSTTRHADKVRRLSIQFGNVEDATLPNNMRLSQVRTLAFWGVFKCMPYITEFQLLKVVILHLWGDEDNISFDLSGISDLFRLRYLQVTCNVTLKLQTHMHGLQYLETLKIDGKSVVVPSDIVHLPGLLHLNLPAKTNLPNGIAHMTSLRTLGIFDLSCASTENMRSLGELTNLRDLQLVYSTARSDNLMRNMQCLGSILEKLSNLKFLTLSTADFSHENTLNVVRASSMRIFGSSLSWVSSPPALLQRLELLPRFRMLSKLPKWIGQLDNLCILKIGVGEVASNDVDVLGGLLALTVLSLYVHKKPAKRIVFNGVGFSVLKYFKFRCSLSWLKFEPGAMPNLRKLKLHFDVFRPNELASIPDGIEHLSGLEEISTNVGVFDDLCRRFAESMLDKVIRMHPGRPSVNMRYVAWTFNGKKVGIREEEQENIIIEGSTENSAVEQNDPGEGAHKSVRKRKKKEPARRTAVLKKLEEMDDGFSWRKYGKQSSEHSHDKQSSTNNSTHSDVLDAQHFASAESSEQPLLSIWDFRDDYDSYDDSYDDGGDIDDENFKLF
ncbi:hypothetical protein GUJ93_ZPchr0011g27680 [Zizania palustris]|uniref:Uncharacterized protein n=1 Tax=Zizania palustris TaxID=103762 RepID=A0A8J5WL09_ZIZPA|nr:hypothetical protein GUJ93_ZPchr0011g27680 [Zizania palustris]